MRLKDGMKNKHYDQKLKWKQLQTRIEMGWNRIVFVEPQLQISFIIFL